MLKCAIYARVSTADQDSAAQLLDLRRYCKRSNWEISAEYVDAGKSGATLDRPAFRDMMAAASRREFDVLLFWRLDRITRTGIADTLNTLHTLSGYGLDFHSYNEPLFRSDGPMRDLLISIHATFAQIERTVLIERTHAGIARARSQGKRIGRPPRLTDAGRIAEMVSAGKSAGIIAKTLHISKATAARRIKAITADQ